MVQMGVGVHGIRGGGPAGAGGGPAIERYRLQGLWSLHAYGYEAELRVRGRVYAVAPGAVGVVAPGEESGYRFAGRSEHVYAHFALPARDNGVSEGGAAAVPVLTPPGGAFDAARFAADLREALAWFPARLRRAEARLWDLLWRLAEDAGGPADGGGAGSPAGGGMHPAVRQALALIEGRMAEGVRVSEIAREVGLSPGHLTRLFRAATGKTVIAALLERRVARARHLLVFSDLPVKAIAAQVGIDDLNRFNKTIRRLCGDSPRALRARGPGG